MGSYIQLERAIVAITESFGVETGQLLVGEGNCDTEVEGGFSLFHQNCCQGFRDATGQWNIGSVHCEGEMLQIAGRCCTMVSLKK